MKTTLAMILAGTALLAICAPVKQAQAYSYRLMSEKSNALMEMVDEKRGGDGSGSYEHKRGAGERREGMRENRHRDGDGYPKMNPEERRKKMEERIKNMPPEKQAEMRQRMEENKARREKMHEELMKLPPEERKQRMEEMREEFKKKHEEGRAERLEKFKEKWDSASPEKRQQFCSNARARCAQEDGGGYGCEAAHNACKSVQ